jgi:hypothetical protein
MMAIERGPAWTWLALSSDGWCPFAPGCHPPYWPCDRSRSLNLTSSQPFEHASGDVPSCLPVSPPIRVRTACLASRAPSLHLDVRSNSFEEATHGMLVVACGEVRNLIYMQLIQTNFGCAECLVTGMKVPSRYFFRVTQF